MISRPGCLILQLAFVQMESMLFWINGKLCLVTNCLSLWKNQYAKVILSFLFARQHTKGNLIIEKVEWDTRVISLVGKSFRKIIIGNLFLFYEKVNGQLLHHHGQLQSSLLILGVILIVK